MQVFSPNEPDSPSIPTTPGMRAAHDLTNFKLAQNQTELSKQIEELKATVEAQGLLLGRLLQALERRDEGNEPQVPS